MSYRHTVPCASSVSQSVLWCAPSGTIYEVSLSKGTQMLLVKTAHWCSVLFLNVTHNLICLKNVCKRKCNACASVSTTEQTWVGCIMLYLFGHDLNCQDRECCFVLCSFCDDAPVLCMYCYTYISSFGVPYCQSRTHWQIFMEVQKISIKVISERGYL